MHTNNCNETKDATRSGLNESADSHKPFGFVIPAGILIGAGMGMLVDQVGPGFLIGLGLGFLGSVLLPFFWKPQESGNVLPGKTDVTMLLIGAFLVVTGVGLVFGPAALWSYAIPGFMILLGTWFLVRGIFSIG